MAQVAAAANSGKICVSALLGIHDEIVNKGLGPQHNTQIANATNGPIKVILKHSEGGVNKTVIESKKYRCFPTPHGTVTAYVIKYINGCFGEYADNFINDDSDRSFIVKEASTGDLVFVNSKYGGSVWTE